MTMRREDWKMKSEVLVFKSRLYSLVKAIAYTKFIICVFPSSLRGDLMKGGGGGGEGEGE